MFVFACKEFSAELYLQSCFCSTCKKPALTNTRESLVSLERCFSSLLHGPETAWKKSTNTNYKA